MRPLLTCTGSVAYPHANSLALFSFFFFFFFLSSSSLRRFCASCVLYLLRWRSALFLRVRGVLVCACVRRACLRVRFALRGCSACVPFACVCVLSSSPFSSLSLSLSFSSFLSVLACWHVERGSLVLLGDRVEGGALALHS